MGIEVFLISVYVGVLILSIVLRHWNLNLAATIFSQFYFVGGRIIFWRQVSGGSTPVFICRFIHGMADKCRVSDGFWV
ncbi:hypothetical protein BJ741DRAFT_714976 [Chytriomyces cf. hyalinus JEL632]|nr:hypothetical protein BJ741DRAFT_714976 [Chytriomyces cf. hyalinus JEL632]